MREQAKLLKEAKRLQVGSWHYNAALVLWRVNTFENAMDYLRQVAERMRR